jgi:DNA repair protein RadC
MKTIRRYELKVKRIKVEEHAAIYNQKINNPEVIKAIATQLIGDNAVETMIAFYLDSRFTIQGFQVIGQGGFTSAPVDPKVVFCGALQTGAVAIILAHNHPSGSLAASAEDIKVTNRIIEGGRILGIELLDHIIVTDDRERSQSMRDAGLHLPLSRRQPRALQFARKACFR